MDLEDEGIISAVTNVPPTDDAENDNDNDLEAPFRSLSRRRSSAASSVSSVVGHGHMTEAEQEERRRQIKMLMRDTSLSQKERSRSIQALMDGRAVVSNTNTNNTNLQLRRLSGSSYASSNASTDYAFSMANAAALAADYYADDQTITEHDYGYGPQLTHEINTAATNAAVAQFGSLHLGSQPNHASANGTAIAAAVSNFHVSPSTHYAPSHRDEQSIASTVTSYDAEATTTTTTAVAASAALPTGRSYRDYHGRSHSLQDWKDTDRLMAAAKATVINPVQISRLMEQSRPACEHYDRKCSIISPCCGLAFGCRICHDECPVLPPPLQNQRRLSATHVKTTHMVSSSLAGPDAVVAASHKNKLERRRSMPVDLEVDDEDDHHLIDRFSIREVICRECYTRQSSKTNNCISCGVQFGEYHCNICNLWMSGKESPYHCSDCGFCRVGGRENFTHCHDCGMCIDAFLVDDHNCKSGKYMNDCPICQEDLFSSRFASHEMPCGHAIHWHCFKELTSYDTRCPVCKKTAESPDQMAATWSTISMGIALQPVPPEMARMVNISCNDCENTSCNLRWHFLGVRCFHCFSFNTNVEQIVMQGRNAAVYLDRLEASYPFHAHGGDVANTAAGAIPTGIPSNISLPSSYVSSIPTARGMDQETDMDEDDLDSNGASEGSNELMDH